MDKITKIIQLILTLLSALSTLLDVWGKDDPNNESQKKVEEAKKLLTSIKKGEKNENSRC